MTDSHGTAAGERLARAAAAIDVPDAPPLARLERRVRRRRNRRVGALASLAFVVAAVGLAVVAQNTGDSDQVVLAAAPARPVGSAQPDWSWIEPAGMRSRDGSATGYGFRPGINGSPNLLIYLADGGLCFDSASCETAQDRYGNEELSKFIATNSVVTSQQEGSPFGGWAVVVVPGSNADMHIGNANFRLALADLKTRLGDASPRRLVFAGTGSGGFGVMLRQAQVATAFPKAIRASIIDGAVVPFTNAALPQCVVDRWTDRWPIRKPGDWTRRLDSDQPLRSAGLYRYLTARWPDDSFGLLTSTADETLRTWYARTGQSCSPTRPISVATFRRSVTSVSKAVRELDNWQVLTVAGIQHGFLNAPADTDAASNQRLWRWIDAVIGA